MFAYSHNCDSIIQKKIVAARAILLLKVPCLGKHAFPCSFPTKQYIGFFNFISHSKLYNDKKKLRQDIKIKVKQNHSADCNVFFYCPVCLSLIFTIFQYEKSATWKYWYSHNSHEHLRRRDLLQYLTLPVPIPDEEKKLT